MTGQEPAPAWRPARDEAVGPGPARPPAAGRTSDGLLGALLCLVLAACEGERQPRPAGAGADAAEPAEPSVEAAAAAPTLAAIAGQIAAAAARAGAAEAAARRQIIGRAGPDSRVLEALYTPPTLRFYERDGNLGSDGRAVLALIAEVERHGLDVRGYRRAQIDAAAEAVVKAFAAERAPLEKMPSLAAARTGLAATGWIRGGEGGELALVRAAGSGLDEDSLRALAAAVPALAEAAQAARLALQEADLELARAVIRYVIDFGYARPAHPHEYTPPGVVRAMATTRADEILARLKDGRGRTAEVLKSLWPTHPQYSRLLEAVARYETLAAGPGWSRLPAAPSPKVEKGARGPFIAAVRARLVAEGYELAPEGEAYDDEMVEAVVDFQKHHQLQPDGVITATVAAEMNVPVARRLAQLRLALQRWREANARNPESFFFHVNVASQLVEVWEDGKVLRTHRIIVGKDDDDIDYEALLKGKINRTKLFSKPMTQVILAPRWYPTQRVIDLELGPAVAKDPAYLEKGGYKSEMKADGSEVVYQLAGKDNLLGWVKFQFPNEHHIYMHDTPFRHLFSKARRAYSHGCIRMEDAIKMAWFVLGRDRGMTRKQIEKVFEEREEKIVNLKKQIPVHIDYISASVDDAGEVFFWSDIYGYDAAYFAGQLPVEEVEEYKPASLKGL